MEGQYLVFIEAPSGENIFWHPTDSLEDAQREWNWAHRLYGNVPGYIVHYDGFEPVEEPPLIEFVVPVFYVVLATRAAEAREAVVSTLEQHEYDQEEGTVGYFTTVCVGNEDEVTTE
jgi:hypothetical protein